MRKNSDFLDYRSTRRTSIILIVQIVLSIPVIWMGITSTIQEFKAPSMTRTEVTLRIPQSFMLHFISDEEFLRNKELKRNVGR